MTSTPPTNETKQTTPPAQNASQQPQVIVQAPPQKKKRGCWVAALGCIGLIVVTGLIFGAFVTGGALGSLAFLEDIETNATLELQDYNS